MKDRFGFDWSKITGTQFWRRPQMERRMFFRHVASAVSGYFLMPSRPAETIAKAAPALRGTAKNCIFVLMAGGPSQIDTFDFKDGAWMPASFAPANFGEIRWPQGAMPLLAEQLGNIALVRSMRSWALVHNLAKTWVQIGRNPALSSSRIAPHIGSVVSLELSAQEPNRALPVFVHLNTTAGPGNGYLPPDHSPFYVSPGGGGMANTTHSLGQARFERRHKLYQDLSADLRQSRELGAEVHEAFAFNDAARRLTYNPEVTGMFTFDQNERNRYGATGFGNACIAARNLLRARSGVRFIQINQGDWDHHEDIYVAGKGHMLLTKQFDSAMGTLLRDLQNDGLLDQTLVVCVGEFGRIPGAPNAGKGRDHHVQQSVLFAGAGVKGGRAIGSTDASGGATKDPGWSRGREVRAEDIEATIYSAMGIDYTTVRRDDPIGRGFEYVPFSDRDLYGPMNELWL